MSEKRAYVTAEEHRAYVDGVFDATKIILDNAALFWCLGRDNYDLDALRDEILKIRLNSAQHVTEAQKIEKERNKNDSTHV